MCFKFVDHSVKNYVEYESPNIMLKNIDQYVMIGNEIDSIHFTVIFNTLELPQINFIM